MSSTAPITTTSTSSTPSPTNNITNTGNNPGSFYKNLFYILIGLLAAFGLVSFLSLMRARRRRHAIVREAERLGVIVPGVPGYIPLRDRRNLNWMKADGSNQPDWWEIEKAKGENGVNSEDTPVQQSSAIVDDHVKSNDEFHPLAIIPPKPAQPTVPPIPFSSLPFFPNHLAYRPESLVPPPSKFVDCSSDPKVLNELINERIEIVTIIKMPIPPDQQPKPRPAGGVEVDDEDDPESIVREWNGIELGITHASVANGYGSGPRGWNG
ncbi:hypothetical protein I302_101907 [Kwoniella bestiolae CBS 10118]|uniref:Uncharacterized protein n=1 Tax=Kwoniella bestiolae CBS 10118 TaxID=1296100 RepID=A0A1B9GDJ1_9TREE|nr:hypothetical protein I302_00589 [Kwoniella bestiolae CBS 10118]OCF29097.1 hypothetical protein I302_00589 [Kwoniella bestiolae CBS 10118]